MEWSYLSIGILFLGVILFLKKSVYLEFSLSLYSLYSPLCISISFTCGKYDNYSQKEIRINLYIVVNHENLKSNPNLRRKRGQRNEFAL